jgi:metal-responsive CopG/Arc/MetJ family transcriptional regulator
MVRKTDGDQTARFSITLLRDVMERIENYRNRRGHVTTANAVRELLMAGLEAAELEASEKDRK